MWPDNREGTSDFSRLAPDHIFSSQSLRSEGGGDPAGEEGRLDAHLAALIWEDNAYGLIEWKQENEFGRHTDLSFGNPDWLKLAEAFGWNGFRCENSRDLRKTLDAAFAADGPSLVVVPIDYRENSLLTQRLGSISCPL